VSMRPLAEGRNIRRWRDFVVSESQLGRMLRTDRFKYCIFASDENREQLTDLKNDPGEMRNLAGIEQYKDVLDMHRRLLRRWIERTGDRIGAKYVNVKS